MFDLSKIQNAAKEIGLDLQVNSKNPGIHFVKSNGSVDVFTFDELQKSLVDEFQGNKSKNDFKYNLKAIGHFRLDIHAGGSKNNHLTVDEISLTVSGHNSKKNSKIELSTQLDGLISKGNYKHSNTEAA